MNSKIPQKVAIALSGGVDSAVAAKILKDQGHELVGFFLKLWSDPLCQVKGENRCCDYEALEDARSVASSLNIPFYVIDAKDEFKREVVDYFIDEYKHARTPNPCVICNEKIKFDLLLKKALAIGCEALATGHYARIEDSRNPKSEFRNPNKISNLNDQISGVIPSGDKVGVEESHHRVSGKSVEDSSPSAQNDSLIHYALFTGVDESKDQSYNLYRLRQDQLSKIIFPLGEMTKKEVRELAVKWNLPVKEKAESQEICFFGDSDYREFLKRYLPKENFQNGEIADLAGEVVGQHEGLVNYTIGQRKGVDQQQKNLRTKELKNKTVCHSELDSESRRSRNKFGTTEKRPLYVIDFEVESNRLIVGEDKDTYKKEMTVADVSWINPLFCHSDQRRGIPLNNITVKIRSQAKAFRCSIVCHPELAEESHNRVSGSRKTDSSHSAQNDKLEVVFDEPQRAVTPGQSAVFYIDDEVIGGGIIA